MKLFLDTHAAVFLAEGRSRRMGPRARAAMERSALFLSPIVRLEIGFLVEVGKLKPAALALPEELARALSVAESRDPLDRVVEEALDLTWTRDPFDRLLVATARLHRAHFVTSDRRILENFSEAIW